MQRDLLPLLAQLQPSAHCYCRVGFTAEPAGNQRELSGCAIFTSMAALKPDFFVANGDMIYADDGCPPERPLAPLGAGANEPHNSPPPVRKNIPGRFPGVLSPTVDWTDLNQLRRVYRLHRQYNRADPAVQHFFQHVPMYAQWDDHEVLNDFGARWAYWE